LEIDNIRAEYIEVSISASEIWKVVDLRMCDIWKTKIPLKIQNNGTTKKEEPRWIHSGKTETRDH
jgi:hypothetical protein